MTRLLVVLSLVGLVGCTHKVNVETNDGNSYSVDVHGCKLEYRYLECWRDGELVLKVEVSEIKKGHYDL